MLSKVNFGDRLDRSGLDQHSMDQRDPKQYNQDQYNQDQYNQDQYNQDQYNQDQYSLAKILAIWFLATAPMALLVWVIAPRLIPRTLMEPTLVYWSLVIVGMMWQFVLSIIVLRGEGVQCTWDALSERLWLRRPQEPVTGNYRPALYWSVIGGIVFVYVTSDLLGTFIDAPFAHYLPAVMMPDYADIRKLMAPQFAGHWQLFVFALISSVFNYVLGEALLFHGVLLPKMTGVFGRWAWVANAVVFGLYHLHIVWLLPSIIISNLAYSYPAQRYRSVWLAVLIHGFEGIVLLIMVFWVVLGRPDSVASL